MVKRIGGDILNYWVKVQKQLFKNIGTSEQNMSDDRIRFICHQL